MTNSEITETKDPENSIELIEEQEDHHTTLDPEVDIDLRVGKDMVDMIDLPVEAEMKGSEAGTDMVDSKVGIDIRAEIGILEIGITIGVEVGVLH